MAAECEYRDEHPALRADLVNLEARVDRIEQREDRVGDALAAVDKRLAHLEGRMIGYLVAAGVLALVLETVAKGLFTHVARAAGM